MMKEARLIVPTHSRAGRPAPHVTKTVRDFLITNFGGFTETIGSGGYRNQDGYIELDAVLIFDVAIDYDMPSHQALMRGIARKVCIGLNQECVYLRQTNGLVEFVTQEKTP